MEAVLSPSVTIVRHERATWTRVWPHVPPRAHQHVVVLHLLHVRRHGFVHQLCDVGAQDAHEVHDDHERNEYPISDRRIELRKGNDVGTCERAS